MYKEMNRRPLRNNLIWAVILLAAAAVILCVVGPQNVLDTLRPAHADDFDTVEEMEGRYVELEVNFIWEPFYYVGDSREEATEIGYMVAIRPLENMDDYYFEQYIGVTIRGAKLQLAEALYKRGNTAYNETWDAADLGQSIHVRGVVEPLDDEETPLFAEMAEATSMNDGHAVPLILRDGEKPLEDDDAFLLVLAAVLAVWAVFLIVRACTGTYQKELRRWCAVSGDPVSAQAHLEQLYAAQPLPGGLHVDDELILYNTGAHTRLLQTADVVWVYTQAIHQRRNGIYTGTTYYLVLADGAGKRHSVPMRGESEAMEASRALFWRLPQAAFGYDAERDRMYRKDRGALSDVAGAQHVSGPVDAPADPAEGESGS